MSSHRGLSAALLFLQWELSIRVDLVLESRHEAAPGRPGHFPPVVASRARQPADAGHLTPDAGIS